MFPSPVGEYCVMLFRKSSKSFSPSLLPNAALSNNPEQHHQFINMTAKFHMQYNKHILTNMHQTRTHSTSLVYNSC